MRTVQDVVDRLTEISDTLPRRDGVAVFNRVYLDVTEHVQDCLAEGYFRDRRFVERLDVAFAQLYIDAYKAMVEGKAVPPAWAPLSDARRRRGVLPVQFALAGMNAHINHDLALAVVATCARTRRELPSVRDDYERVNDVLAEVVRPIRQSFLDEVVVRAGAPLSPVADVVSSWSIDQARDAAWVHARALWELRAVRPVAHAYRRTLARTVGLVGRQLLVRAP